MQVTERAGECAERRAGLGIPSLSKGRQREGEEENGRGRAGEREAQRARKERRAGEEQEGETQADDS